MTNLVCEQFLLHAFASVLKMLFVNTSVRASRGGYRGPEPNSSVYQKASAFASKANLLSGQKQGIWIRQAVRNQSAGSPEGSKKEVSIPFLGYDHLTRASFIQSLRSFQPR